MATTIRERMLALLERERLSYIALSEIRGAPICRLAYYHRILFKTHPRFVEVATAPAAEHLAAEAPKHFDVALTSGVRVAVAPGFLVHGPPIASPLPNAGMAAETC